MTQGAAGDLKEENKRKIPLKRLIAAGTMTVLGAVGILLARNVQGFADFYGFNIYPVIVNVFARISGIFPFSVGEIMLILAALAVISAIVYFIIGMIRKKGKRLRFAASSGATALFALSLVFFTFTYGTGINYSRKPFSQIAGLTAGRYTKEQLREVLMYTAEKVTEWAPEVTLDSEGHTVLPEGLSDRARAAMEKLSQEYGPLRSYYPPLKPVMLSELMCYGHITGVFSFFSMESNYNQNDVPENRGFIFCHELSHMTGFMREDEANFISYLACTGSGDSYLAYSAYYNALIYLLNAYYPEASGDEYGQALAAIPQSTLKQLVMENEFWDKYKTDFGEVAEAMNDVYLKVNDQSDGTKSYGRVVDLLIADYYAKKG